MANGRRAGGRGSDRRFNVIVFVIDDCGREYLACYDRTTYDPPAPAPPVASITPAWSNQWGVVAQDRSAFGYPPTPWLTSAAKHGLVLERMNVGAMCSPTRCSLLTGLHAGGHRIGNAIVADSVPAFAFEGTAIYEKLRDAAPDYDRVHIGKWHASNSYRQFIHGMPLGAENSEASFRTPVRDAGASFYAGGTMNVGAQVPGFEFPEGKQHHARYVRGTHDGESGEFRMEQRRMHSLLDETEDAITAIRRARRRGRRFLLNVWFHAVHSPVEWDAMGGTMLSRAGFHGYGPDDPGDEALRVSAFVEAVDTACARITGELTPEERSETMVVFLSDNGSTSMMLSSGSNPSLPPVGPEGNPYSPSHAKRSPWQGGIGAACVILGEGVLNPGDGTKPRTWSGLCGAEDLHHQILRWTGTPVDGNGDSDVLQRALDGSDDFGRRGYLQCAFQNGFADDPFSEAQGTSVRFVCQQNADAWKLLWIRAGPEPTPEVRWEWQLYAMHRDPLEAHNRFPEDRGGESIQERYERLSGESKVQFDELYASLRADGLIPPGMAISAT